MTPVTTPDSRSSTTSSSGSPSSRRYEPRAADFRPWQTLTTARELYALPRGSVIANGIPGPLFWIRAHGNGGRWHESTPTGQQLPAVDLLVPADGLPSSQLALPAVLIRLGDGIVT